MNAPTPTQPQGPRRRFPTGYVVVCVLLCLPLVAAYEIVGFFRLSSPAQALRRSVMDTVPGSWNTRITLNIGRVTTSLARLGLNLVPLPPDARTALRSLHGAEVGVYELTNGAPPAHPAAFLPAADKAMKARGWERIVGVVEGHEAVAIYIPQKGISPKRVKCCLAVLQDRELVVVGARGDVGPLLDLAAARSDWARAQVDRQLIEAFGKHSGTPGKDGERGLTTLPGPAKFQLLGADSRSRSGERIVR